MFLRLSISFHQICRFAAVLLAAAALTAGISTGGARAQAPMPFPVPLLAAGDAVVTGFSGVTPPAVPPPPGVDPLDVTFINLDGTSMQIERLQPNGPPAGQLIPSPSIYSALARDVGQVMPITIDDALAPNIYIGASSVFGLNIVAPDPTGALKRVKLGQPGAGWMEGQWGTAKGGTSGSIYKVDGATGAITLFTTIGANAGPGLGDVVFDKSSHQFFVSDLDTGLIYRLDSTGLIVDTFDHGIAGRPAHALAPVADDGATMNVTNPAFNSENPATWGYTQKERRVWGLAIYYGRLYYAITDAIPQVWSIGIQLDGKFAGDPRWELDVAGLASNNAVTDMVFDKEGRIILAQRGPQRGSYDYSVFAEPLTSSVVRYTREIPDNPATPGTWIPAPEQYAIGFPPDRHNADGGVALGYRYDSNGYMRTGSCGEFLWSTGTALRDDPALAAQLAAGGPAIVDGLQGNHRSLVRPANDPPFQSYFTDYDGAFDHPERKGWMGDVEIHQPCQGGYYTPPYFPPGYTPPPTGTFNLKLDKEASPRVCLPSGADWLCSYTVRVTNTGSTVYWGPLSVRDWLPGNPPGTTMAFDFQPPWNCNPLGPNDYQCDLALVLLFPGSSVDLYVTVKVPGNSDLCFLDNAAQILWWPGYGDQNPADDMDSAQAQIPNPKCLPQGPRTNLKIEKRALGDSCVLNAPNWTCIFDIVITNTGPGIYNGPIVVSDTVPAPAVVTNWALKPNPPHWNCVPVPGAAITCDHAPVILNPGQNVHLWIRVDVPVAAQADAGKCTVQNEVRIVQAPGGSNQNFDPTDNTASAEAATRGRHCDPPGDRKTDLSLRKFPRSCVEVQKAGAPVGEWQCSFSVQVKNESATNWFAGPLTVHDVFTPAGSATFGPGWACAGGAGTYDCTLNPGALPMGPGASRWLTMTISVPSNSEVCKVENRANISVPAAPSDANTDPTNDSASASLDIPSDRCRPPRQSNLQIVKKAGACTMPPPLASTTAAVAPGSAPIECAYSVTISNTGPDTYTGNVGWWDSAGPGTGTLVTGPAGWICGPPAPLTGCGYLGLSLAKDAFVSFNVRVRTNQATAQAKGCVVRNWAWIGFPLGFPSNTSAADDISFADATVPADICQSVQLKQQIQACPTNRQMPTGGCCPEGQVWNGKACSGGSVAPPPPPPPGKCPADSTGTYPNCRCKPNTHGTPGQCEPNQCLPPQTGIWPNCFIPPVQVCPSDSFGVFPNCQCKQGTSGVPGKCQPNKCQPPQTGIWPNCFIPPVQVCPSDSVGTYPNCRCKPGTNGVPGQCQPNRCVPPTTGTWPNCNIPPVRVCPSDSTGTYPQCVCKQGTHGTPGKCQPNRCVPPLTGTWPNCTIPPVQTTPTACPSDSTGIPPNCRCKTGTSGTPGKCVQIPILQRTPTITINPSVIVPLTCPQGMIGTPPNCKQDVPK